jgi:hypothetical protein
MSVNDITTAIQRIAQEIDELALAVSNTTSFPFGRVGIETTGIRGVGLVDVAAIEGSQDAHQDQRDDTTCMPEDSDDDEYIEEADNRQPRGRDRG